MSAAQWCIWRITSPARTSKLIRTLELKASVMCRPFKGT
jgi:hypothetical protein